MAARNRLRSTVDGLIHPKGKKKSRRHSSLPVESFRQDYSAVCVTIAKPGVGVQDRNPTHLHTSLRELIPIKEQQHGQGKPTMDGVTTGQKTDSTMVKADATEATATTPQQVSVREELGTAVEATVTDEQPSASPQTESEVPAHPKHDALVLITAVPDHDGVALLMSELSAFKNVSYLQFDLESDFKTCTVKLGFTNNNDTLKDFYTNIVNVLTYPHLLTVLIANTMTIIIEVPPTTTDSPNYANQPQQSHDATICFQRNDGRGLHSIKDEIENVKVISFLKFDIEDYSETNNSVVMVIQKKHSPMDGFFTSVVQFPTYVHLLNLVVDNMVDLRLHISTRDVKYQCYDKIQILANSDNEDYIEATADSEENPPAPHKRPKRKQIGLTKIYSSFRSTVLRHKKK